MNVHLLHILHNMAYGAIISLACYGIYCVVLLFKLLRRRQFPNEDAANEFVNQVRDYVANGQYNEAENLCASPEHWYRAVAYLSKAALEKRDLSTNKIKATIASRFTRDILTSMETMISNINMVIKCEPMLGLLGTVIGMIGAFSTIALIKSPSPAQLMGDLSVALNATAMGLSTAIPLLLVVNFFQVRLRRFEDQTFEQVQLVVEEIEASSLRERVPPPVAARAR